MSSQPFPLVTEQPTRLTQLLKERIKYMFGIDVVPVIIRHPGSYYKTVAFRYLWSMKTECGMFEIACYEPAAVMAEKSAWHVLDRYSLLEYHGEAGVIGKVIY